MKYCILIISGNFPHLRCWVFVANKHFSVNNCKVVLMKSENSHGHALRARKQCDHGICSHLMASPGKARLVLLSSSLITSSRLLQPCIFFLNNPLTPVSAAHMYGATHWSMGSLPVVASSEKSDSPYSNSQC